MKPKEINHKLRLNLYKVEALCYKKGNTQRLYGEYVGENALEACDKADRKLKKAGVDRLSGYQVSIIQTFFFE